ncbi:MAG: hypothetical protein HXY36_04265 [Chloroflexi bacterium]|nr:hypothetical protein [Chloroflexota bacterium]
MKKRDILIITLTLIALVSLVLIIRGIIPETKSLEEIKVEIDNLFLAGMNTTYYGDWVLPEEEVKEMKTLWAELGLGETDVIELWVAIFDNCSNWVDLYTAREFDCSEMSALFECVMEQLGYATCIVESDKYKHAWCLVETSDESLLPVECTGMFIPWEGSNIMTWVDYFVYDMDKRFETIYEAEQYCSGDYDWWNSWQVEELTLDEVKVEEFVSEWLEKYVSHETLLIDKVTHLESGQYWSFSTVFEEGYEIEVMVEVKQGGPIDVLLFNSGQYLQFERFMKGKGTTVEYFVTGSALNVMSKSYTFQIPSSDRYYVVISNGGGIKGGARPKGDVAVYLKVVAIVHP